MLKPMVLSRSLRPFLLLLLLLLLDATSCSSGGAFAPDAALSDALATLDLVRDHPTLSGEARRPDAFRWPDLAANRLYKDIEGLRDQALKAALLALVQGHTALSYNKARSAMFVVQDGGIDVHDGKVECVYTGRSAEADGTLTPGGLNIEHSWPQSEGADSLPAESDLHHLFPVDSSANSRRGNMPFGDTSCDSLSSPCRWQEGGSSIGPSVSSNMTVFQVRPVRRGDIARAHFYFAIRYQMNIPDEEERTLRGWNASDLPDSLEIDRTEAIQAIQKNRNPFIDRPDFVNLISDF
jgi:endonuclease I